MRSFFSLYFCQKATFSFLFFFCYLFSVAEGLAARRQGRLLKLSLLSLFFFSVRFFGDATFSYAAFRSMPFDTRFKRRRQHTIREYFRQ
uniref:Uncharacterized protein n=1 Tax=Ixodes ricinus TaxID=34613 RepID=A0A147BLI3_IXORI